MNTKTPGQIAFEERIKHLEAGVKLEDIKDYSEISSHGRTTYEAVAAAVIAHHEASKDPFAELKAAHAAGKAIEENVAGTFRCGADCPPYWEVSANPDWSMVPSRYRIKPEQPQPKFKVGDRIRRVSYDNRCAPLGHEVIVLSNYTYIDLEGDSIVIDDSCWEKVEWALPAPPPGRATIKLLIPIKLNHGNFSFASK